MRIVKRSPALKIDLVICLSMASYEIKRLNADYEGRASGEA